MQSSEFLSLSPISEMGICKALRRLRLSKFLGLDDITSFVIKSCSEFLVPVLKHIFSLSLTRHCLPIVWKQATLRLLVTTDPYLYLIHFADYLNLLFTIFHIT